MRVLNNYVLINELKPAEVQSMTGLVFSAEQTSNMRYAEGIVEEVGENLGFELKKGDKIVYDQAQGHHVVLDGVTYRVILGRDVAIVL